jgi:hypothetical protein
MKTYTVEVENNGDKFWYLDGKRHREDGPAIELTKGPKFWYQNDKRHREDGPACECADGSKHWYQKGKLHREDGPAMEYPNGTKRWYINGKELTEEQFNNRNKGLNGKIVTIDGKQYKLTELA